MPTDALSRDDFIEIHLTNPHVYGNEDAYRTLLNTTYLFNNIKPLQKVLSTACMPFQIAGFTLLALALIFLGAAITAALMQSSIKNVLSNIGFMAAWAGGYLMIDNVNMPSFDSILSLNTYGRQSLMMLYSLWIGLYALDYLTEQRKRIWKTMVLISAAFDGVIWVLSITGCVLIYDTLIYWVGLQFVFCTSLVVLCIWELCRKEKHNRTALISCILLPIAIVLDIFRVGDSFYTHAICSKITFTVFFLFFCIMTLAYVISNYKTALRTKAIEKELEENRIAIMLSQIQPHFLYNALTTIKYLCRQNDPRTEDVVSKFAKYLRGNMDSLSIRVPIPFESEMVHLEYYLSIEMMRFPGVQIAYDINVKDFMLPALTIQPLVENAIRYGVTRKENRAGTVTISTWQDESAWFVSVADDGVGFNPKQEQNDGRSHIGIANTRKRLMMQCHGTLSIKSIPDKGTTITIMLPKEKKA